jgi:hypothetical protein
MNLEPTKSNIHYERLLDDIFLNEDLVRFKEDVLSQCQSKLTRQRVRRHYLSILTGVAALFLLALVIFYAAETPPTKLVESTNTPDYLVHTIALPEHQIVRSTWACDTVQNQNTDYVVYSTVCESDLMIPKQYRIARMTDSDVLNQFKGIACGIIHPQGGVKQFVFLNLEDTQRFFRTQ